jgi:hypothetical protein
VVVVEILGHTLILVNQEEVAVADLEILPI